MIRALIFDCFGVLYNEGKAHLIALCPPERINELKSLYAQSDYGFIGRDEFVENVTSLLGISKEKFTNFERDEYVRNEPLFDFIRAKKVSYKTGLLSNVGERFLETLIPAEEQTGLFDEVVLSSQVGMVKPAREIYELMVARLGLVPEECVFIDDIPANVEGARIAGMNALLFTTNRQLELDLGALLGGV